MANIQKTLNDLRDEIIGKIGAYNAALKENDAAKLGLIEQELRETEQSYAEAKCVEVFGELKESENPVKAAIEKHSYLVVSHRPTREEGVVTGFELVEDKVRQIDLVRFCKFCKLPTGWQFMVEKFNQLLALRAANELKLSKAQINKICDSFYMNSLARQVEMGETPDSNTAICKQLQKVLDAVLFEDNGKGKNVYRVNNHDVAYILMCYSKRGKKVLSVSLAKNAYMHRLFLDVAHRVVTNKAYDLEYRMVSAAEKASEPSVKAKKSETAKAKSKSADAETVVVEKSA